MPTGFKSALDGKEVLSVKELRKRFAADVGESTNYDSIALSTLRAPTTRGLFGSKIDDRELLFAVQREPAAFRIVFGVAKDTLDNWFTIELINKDDKGATNEKVQKELTRLQAKWKFIKLLTLKRLFGYSILIKGYKDDAAKLENELTDKTAQIAYIEPYSKLEINRFIDVDDPEDERDGYPQFYVMKKSAGLVSNQVRVHYSRGILCSSLVVDHRYLGWSVLQALYDDITGYRYMRYGFYQTIIRYGSGFPDVTLMGPEADQKAINAFIASGQFDNLNGMKYFVHNEQQKLEFKGFASASLNPINYYQIALETLSMGSGIPEPVLKGSQAGAITGSEINERAYFKVISDEQTDFEQVIRDLVDSILLYLELGTEEEPLDYKIVWKPSYEPTAKEKAELDFLNAQTAEKELLCKTVDEVRNDRFKLKPLPDKAGAVVIGLAKPSQPQSQGVNPFNPDGTPKSSSQIADEQAALDAQQTGQPQSSPSKPAVAQPKQESPPMPGADASEPPPATPAEKAAAEKKSKPESVDEKSISRTLPMLLREIGQNVMDGTESRDSAFQRGKNMIVEYARLEQEQALLWVKHKSGFPGVVIVPQEMQRKLDLQRKQFVEDLDVMLKDAEAVYKMKSAPAVVSPGGVA
jgi:hypothetical protein